MPITRADLRQNAWVSSERNAEDEYEQQKRRNRLEIVEGLIAAQDRWHDVSAAVEAADDRSAAVDSLRVLLKISEPVAHHILDMTLGRRSRLARAELTNERGELRRQLDNA